MQVFASRHGERPLSSHCHSFHWRDSLGWLGGRKIFITSLHRTSAEVAQLSSMTLQCSLMSELMTHAQLEPQNQGSLPHQLQQRRHLHRQSHVQSLSGRGSIITHLRALPLLQRTFHSQTSQCSQRGMLLTTRLFQTSTSRESSLVVHTNPQPTPGLLFLGTASMLMLRPHPTPLQPRFSLQSLRRQHQPCPRALARTLQIPLLRCQRLDSIAIPSFWTLWGLLKERHLVRRSVTLHLYYS